MGPIPSGKRGAEIGFKAGEGRIEHLSARHDNDIESCGRFVVTEQLAREPFCAVPDDGRAKLPGRRDSQTALRGSIRPDEYRHEPPRQTHAVVVRVLELRAFPDTLSAWKTLRHRGAILPFVGNGQTLATLSPAALQHDPAVLCRHSHPKTVSFAAAPPVGLVRPLSLCHAVLLALEVRVRAVTSPWS